jgi:hypothetical protein
LKIDSEMRRLIMLRVVRRRRRRRFMRLLIWVDRTS